VAEGPREYWFIPYSKDAPHRTNASRETEIFYDYLLLQASDTAYPIFEDKFESALSHNEKTLRDHLDKYLTQLPDEARQAPAWEKVKKLYKGLGSSRKQLHANPIKMTEHWWRFAQVMQEMMMVRQSAEEYDEVLMKLSNPQKLDPSESATFYFGEASLSSDYRMDQMPNTVDAFVQVLTSGPTLHWTGRDRNLQSTPEQKILLKALINEFNSCEDPQVRFMAVASFLVKCSDIEAKIGLVTKYDIIRRYSGTLYFLADYPTGDDDHTASLATGVLSWCAKTLIKLGWAEKFPTSKKRDQKAGKVWEKLGKEHERKARDLLLVEEKCVNAFLRTSSGLGSPGDLLSNRQLTEK